MENQHRKISGYRELNAEEIDLMNRVKAAGAALLALHEEVTQKLNKGAADVMAAAYPAGWPGPEHEEGATPPESVANARAERERWQKAEPHRWAAIAKTDLQTGVMALVRAVAQPSDC